jgi:hypothetical protein
MSQETGIEWNSEDINLSSRDIKGFNFEVLVSKLLDKSGIDYSANPLDNIKVWKQYQGKGSDFKIPSLNIELEAKSGYARIFKSWILRDWIPRFSYHNEVRVVIVKPTLKLSSKVFDLLFSYNINLIYPDSISYLIGKGNKVIEPDKANKESGKVQSSNKEAKSTDSELESNKVLEPISSKSIEANKLLEAISSRSSSIVLNNIEKIEGKSVNSESSKPKSFKSSSTFVDKLKCKIRRIPKFIAKSLSIFEPFLRVLSKLWNDKHGSAILASWMTIKPKIQKPKDNRRRLFQCPFRIVLICPHYKQFYVCLYKILIDYESHLEKYGFSEEQIDRMTDRLILDRTWKHKNLILGKCKCRPESIIDDEITSRIPIPRYGIASLDPCKSYRCSELIKEGKCEWLELLKENRAKPFQSKIPNYLEVKTCQRKL